MNLATIDPSLADVDRWLARREVSGAALANALEVLVERRIAGWARGASAHEVDEAARVLSERGLSFAMGAPRAADRASHVDDSLDGERNPAPVLRARAVDLLRSLTQAHGAEAYEIVEQAFRRSIAKFGARFVATHARAAIDDTMGPMHSNVVAADLLSMLERIDVRYLEALTYALETMHDWGVVAARTAESSEKTRATLKRKTRALSSPKRRA